MSNRGTCTTSSIHIYSLFDDWGILNYIRILTFDLTHELLKKRFYALCKLSDLVSVLRSLWD